MTITLTSQLDQLKGNWYVWACRVELPDGQTVDGSVQADGYGQMIAEETLELDE